MTVEQVNKVTTPLSGAAAGPVEQALVALRGQIRRYVLVHGIASAVVWIFATFWFALLLDYLPVLLGFQELSGLARTICLLAMAFGLGFILVRQVIQRVRRRLSPDGLALLLERRFPEFADSLATVVQPATSIDPVLADSAARQQSDMLAAAKSHAESTLQKVSISNVFNYRPLVTAIVLSLILGGSIAGLAWLRPQMFSTAMQRLYFLEDVKWPRQCYVELVGVRVRHADSVDGIPGMSEVKTFRDSQVAVARSAAISLLVRAELPDGPESGRRLPRACQFIYRTADGDRGRHSMSKIGGARNGFQSYALNEEILEHVTSDIRFYVQADDHTIGPYLIRAVEPPVVTDVQLDCVYPDYLVDELSSRYTARQIQYTPGMNIPVGTRVRMNLQMQSPAGTAWLLDQEGQVQYRQDWANHVCQLDLNEMNKAIDLSIVLENESGVFAPSRLNYRLDCELDKPPVVTSRLNGIGSAVTPEATIPVVSQIEDKNGIQRTWIEVETPFTDTLTLEQDSVQDSLETEVDLRRMRLAGLIPVSIPDDAEAEIQIVVVSKDHFDLQGGQNIGQGPRHPLEIVSADKLLRILERDEADQRFRLEQILQEMSDARNYIRRAGGDSAAEPAGFEPGDETNEPVVQNQEENLNLRRLFAQRALLQCQKSTQEIDAVAFSFDHIRLQLINNRIDAEDRKLRLENDVAIPLRRIVNESMPNLEQALMDSDELFQRLESVDQADSAMLEQLNEATLQALVIADNVLAEIQSVLDSLLKFETQNELLDLVRRMIDEQAALRERTEALRNREAFDDIFNK